MLGFIAPPLIPVKTGIQKRRLRRVLTLESRVRGNKRKGLLRSVFQSTGWSI